MGQEWLKILIMHYLFWNLEQFWEDVIIPILRLREPRLREFKWGPGSAKKGLNQNSNPVLSYSEVHFLNC